jgi:hypothetical protein
MPNLKHALTLGLVATAAVAPGVASARDDDDIMGGDPQSVVTVFAADGTSSTGNASYGTRAFVDQLRASGAAGGSYETDLIGDMTSPMTTAPADLAEYDVPAGHHRSLSRSGFASPTSPRYRRLFVEGSRRLALRKITARYFTNADGEQVEERGWAVDIASGKVRRVSLDAARRLSLDPRGGTPNTEYVYQVHVRP